MSEAPANDLPSGDPNVIRIAQQFLDLACMGKISAIAVVGIDTAGQVMSSHVMPKNSAVVHITMGALQGLMFNLYGFLQQMVTQMQTSPIIRPGGVVQR